jgi:glycosyltransferase involved in cell wall biosynthesis
MKPEHETDHRIVVNAIPLLGNLTGVGQVVSEVSRRLRDTEAFELNYFTPLKTFSTFEEVGRKSVALFGLRAVKALFRRLPFKNALREVSSRLGHGADVYDLYWEPNFIPHDAIEARRIVTTVHDLSSLEHPEWHPADRVAFFSRNFFQKIDRSDVVVTVSEFTRQRFLEAQSGIGADRVRVIPCGINPDCFRVLDSESVEEIRRQYHLPELFVLFVGSIEPRKNLERLLCAYEQLPVARREACPLVLVGDAGWNNHDIHRRIKRLGRGVRTVGYLKSAQDLARMYNAATVFVYPSLYEGFGIPPLEAMACGTPVCLSSIPVFHEVYGPDTAAYVDPHDPESIADGLIRLLDDEAGRRRQVQRGLALAKQYNWDTVSGQYRDLFRELL